MSYRADKQDRIARGDASNALRHNARIRFDRGTYQAVCKCMWKGAIHSNMIEAQSEAVAHRQKPE